MTKSKGAKMAQSNKKSTDLSLASTPDGYPAPGSDMLPSGLKPKLDLIFSEVEKKLPDIDFDLSDVDSDSEEPLIFHQHLKSLEEDKDLDTSQGSDTLTDNAMFSENKGKGTSESPVTFFDNDIAYEFQRSGINITPPRAVSSWADIPVPAEKDKNKQEKDDTSWSNIPIKKSVSWNDMSRPDNDMPKMDNDITDNRYATEMQGQLSLNSLDDKLIKKKLNREASRNKEKDIATNLLSPRAPILSTQQLDNIDLDSLLESLNTDNQTAPPAPHQAWSDHSRPDSGRGSGEGRQTAAESSSGMTLIQKLAQMSMTQYGEDLSDIDPTTGATRKHEVHNRAPRDNREVEEDVDEESEVMSAGQRSNNEVKDLWDEKWAEKRQPVRQEVPKKQTASCGTNTSDMQPVRIITPRVPPRTQPPVAVTQKQEGFEGLKGDKESTVFIDLRNFEQIRQEQQHSIERVQKVLGIQPERRIADSSDSDEDVEEWKEQRQKFKQQTVSSAKSTRKTYTSGDKPPVHRQPPRVINMADIPSRMRQSAGDSSASETAPVDIEEQKRRLLEEREKERQLEIVKKLREQRESERQAKLRLQKRLDALRPSASVSGRQDPAENTPTVFELDASYEPAPRSLPPVLSPDTVTVLLTIHLSSNGEIVLHRGSGNKSVDTGYGLSASYTALLTWLLALVPNSFSYLQEGVAGPQTPWILPFYVIGLQQVLLDGQLCLIVAVTPVEQFDAKYVHGKSKKNKKSESKNTTVFQQHLQKYFSTNTLHSVCPWLQNMVSMELGPPGADESDDQKYSYMYKPPLPNITTKPLSTFIHVNPDPQAAVKVFNSSVGFFWQTVDSDEARLDQDLHDEGISFDTQNTLSLIYKKIYQEPSAMMGILNRVLQLGLDLAGIRLVYPSPEQMNIQQTDNASVLSELELLNNVGAVLSLCIRGTAARSLWLDAVGPSDPALARRTDPNSLCALYGGESRDECLLFCPRTPARVQTELARWFGGRVPPGNVIDVGTPYTKKDSLRSGSPKGRRGKKVSFTDSKETSGKSKDSIEEVHRPLATLTATTKSEIILVISPLVPPQCFGIILASCQRRGYQVTGVRRTRLSNKRAAAMGITGEGLKAFCPGSASESFDASLADHVDPQGHGQWRECTFPSTILQLLKENASHSAASLVEDCMVQLTLQGIMGTLQKREGYPLESVHMFHAARYSDGLLSTLGGDFSKCFDPEVQINPSYVIPQLFTNPELEQITVLMLLGNDILKTSGLFIGKLLGMLPYSRHHQSLPFSDGLELLGMKWVPRLTVSQAKEVTPCEVGDRMWKDSLHTLATEPCLVLALRGVNAFAKLESVVQPRPSPKSGQQFNLDMIHARTAEEAYTYIRLFFTERELFSDPLARPMLPYIPVYQTKHDMHHFASSRSVKETSTYPLEETIFEQMLSGPRPFTTFLVIKPRAFQRHLSKIFKKLAQESFKIVALKIQILTTEQAQRLVPSNLQKDEIEKHEKHLTSGPCVCLCVQRENAVKRLLDLLGPEDPQSARRHSQFYWRGVFGVDPVSNAIYASKTYREAVEDEKLFFPDGLCCEETDISLQEMITCPAVDQEIAVKYSSHRDVVISTAVDSSNTDASHMLLLQTTCIVLTPLLMRQLGSHHGYVDVIDGLIAQGFEFVGGRMVWFTQEQAEHFLCSIEAGSFQQVPMLVSSPCLVLALQRDNAVLAFDTILRETFSTESSQGKSVTDSLLHKYGRLILRPSDLKQAQNVLGFFFNSLLPTSKLQIVQK
ncbi:dynein axonemal assembly factor 8-like isoform X2 [Mercenaria mercenaria]|uniref:dynein axonemal assembly factor 8-like isoform X2 n=1 Tax=Mercenaria mercenaria TaxID=6596 RepID=UPI00234ED949|nr:dynein axonemal assembly factor 8-like isoform X2 [Mercenaria mercenaria]